MMQPYTPVKVLIAERAPNVADGIARILREQGYAIAGIVHSGEKALEFATLTVPDIVLMDLPLAGAMDGLTAAYKIYEELHCPVIYMTTSTDHYLRQRAHQTKAYGYLQKPFTVDQLSGLIEEALQQYWLERSEDMQFLAMGSGEEEDYDEATWHKQFLALLSVASLIQPQPRILFEDEILHIYTSVPEAARIMSRFCRSQVLLYPYQIYTWTWKNAHYYPYDLG